MIPFLQFETLIGSVKRVQLGCVFRTVVCWHDKSLPRHFYTFSKVRLRHQQQSEFIYDIRGNIISYWFMIWYHFAPNRCFEYRSFQNRNCFWSIAYNAFSTWKRIRWREGSSFKFQNGQANRTDTSQHPQPLQHLHQAREAIGWQVAVPCRTLRDGFVRFHLLP